MRKVRKNRKRLSVERLESRLLFARAQLVEHAYREDDFSIAGTYTYRMHEPAEYDYIDTINNGTYASSSGHVEWTSPKDGKGFFEGKALGDGRDTVDFLGRRDCSEYGIEDIGRFSFTLNAQTSSMRIDRTEEKSTRYTYYRDLTGGYCEQPNPPWSRFFGGRSSLYIGTFSAADHKASIRYDGTNPEIVVDSPKADVKWSQTAATDLSLTATTHFDEIEFPDGWEYVPQDSERPDRLDFVDVVNGGIELTVDVRGKPMRTSNVMNPVARVRLYWAKSNTDLTGAEIPIDSGSVPVGVYWNSSQLHAVVDQFPTKPAGATHVRVTVELDSGPDANPANNATFLKIGEFEARSDVTGPVNEDGYLDGTASSVLHLADAGDPDIKVFAFKPESALGASVSIEDDEGAYFYNPSFATEIQKLAPNETANDAITFLAIKYQTLIDEVTRVVTLEGANDEPIAEYDERATTNFQNLSLTPAFLLANDWDVDNGDRLTVHAVDTTSAYGANVRLVWNDSLTEIREIIYVPATSPTMRQMNEGEVATDSLNYEIIDRYGGVGYGLVAITVTGEKRRLMVSEIADQMTIVDLPTSPLHFSVDDPDGDPSHLQLSATSTNAAVVDAAGFQFDGTGSDRTLVVTPVGGATGRTEITVTVSDNGGHSVATTFSLIVGSTTDGDLDGVSNAEEDEAPNGGDMNQDFILDSQQPNVASLRAHGGAAYVSVAVAPGRILESVSVAEHPSSSGVAASAQMPIGMIHYEVLVENPGTTAMVTFRSDYATAPLNRYFQYDGASSSWRYLMHNKADGARIYPDRIEVLTRDGGRADQAPSDSTRIVGDAVLANVAFPWRNIVREDIDNDGAVVPLDVLALINQLNSGGSRSLGTIPSNGEALPYFIDPSGSNSLEPIDALVVINFLNQRAAQNGEGEGVSSVIADELFAQWDRSTLTTRERATAKKVLERIPAAVDRFAPLYMSVQSDMSDGSLYAPKNKMKAASNRRTP